MTLIELIVFVLIIVLAINGAKFFGESLGVVGYVGGFLVGGALIPMVLMWIHRLPPPNDK